MVVSVFKTFLSILWTLIKIPIFILAAVLALFGFLCAVQYLYLHYRKGYSVKPGQHFKVDRKGFFRRLFYEAPRRIILWLIRCQKSSFVIHEDLQLGWIWISAARFCITSPRRSGRAGSAAEAPRGSGGAQARRSGAAAPY